MLAAGRPALLLSDQYQQITGVAGCLFLVEGQLCISSDTVGDLLDVVMIAIQVITLVVIGKQGGSGKDKDDVIIIIQDQDDPGSEDYWQCLTPVNYDISWDGCADTPAFEFIEVPTAGGYALESEFYYNEGESLYMTTESDSNGSDVILSGIIEGGAIDRTWYFPDLYGTDASVHGVRDGYQLAA